MPAQTSPYTAASSTPSNNDFGKEASSYADKASDTANQAYDSVRDAADSAVEKGREFANDAERAAVDAYASVKRFAEEQPLLTIAAVAVTAIAAGAVINRLSRPSRNAIVDQLSAAIEPHYRNLQRNIRRQF